jgi:hypothetical protein
MLMSLILNYAQLRKTKKLIYFLAFNKKEIPLQSQKQGGMILMKN